MSTETKESTKPTFDFKLPADLKALIDAAPSVTVARNIDDLVNLSVNGEESIQFDVCFDLPDGTRFHEATVHRVKKRHRSQLCRAVHASPRSGLYGNCR